MKRRWRYLLGAFLLAAGLLAGCADITQPGNESAAGIISEDAEWQEREAEDPETEDPEAEDPEAEKSETEDLETEIPETESPEEQEIEESESGVFEDGAYVSKEEVAEYLHLYGHLPDNFITKKEAKALGWVSSEGNLDEVAPGKSIGGDYFGNFEGNLPEKKGREYHECDIDSDGGYRGGKRIVYSNDGLIYYTEDHYETFELLYGEE